MLCVRKCLAASSFVSAGHHNEDMHDKITWNNYTHTHLKTNKSKNQVVQLQMPALSNGTWNFGWNHGQKLSRHMKITNLFP